MTDSTDRFDRKKLFLLGVITLFTVAMSTALRGANASALKSGVLDGIDITQSGAMLGSLLGVSFLGFAITLFVASPLLDKIGMGNMFKICGTCYLVGISLMISADQFASGMDIYNILWVSMVLQGIGWGCMEATVNPMTMALYPEDKTHRLNLIHAWWPGGVIVGALVGLLIDQFNLGWQVSMSLVLIPTIAFLYLSNGLSFPQTERADAGISNKEMFFEVLKRPSFFIWFGAMFLTTSSELAPGQWVDFALSEKVGMRGIWVLIYISGLMFVMRHFAGPIAHKFSNVGLLWISSALAAIGLYLLSGASSPITAFIAATFWGAGVCFMWPTMLASVGERYPRGGSWAVGLMGSGGALSIYLVLPELGKYYDAAKITAAGGADALAGLSGEALVTVESSAASQSFELVAYIPIALLVVFALIKFIERGHIVRSLQNNEA